MKKEKKTELSGYLGTEITAFVESIGNMNKVNTSDGTLEYSNEKIIVSAGHESNHIALISIDGECNYSLNGISYGMPLSEAVNLLENQIKTVSDDLPYYKYYYLKNGTMFSLHADSENKIDGINLLADTSMADISEETEEKKTSNPDSLIELAQKIYDGHTYTYDSSWDSTKYLYYIAETKNGLCLVVNEGGGLGSEIWIYDEKGNLKTDSTMYAGSKLHFNGTYYDIFDNTSGDDTRYISMYYPEEHEYFENYEYSSGGEKINFSWSLDDKPISKDEFNSIYEEYANNCISTYEYKEGIVYYYHAGKCEEYELKTTSVTTRVCLKNKTCTN